MSAVGIDLEQFIRDPYATGIQRVLQQLALHWPEEIDAHWVVPMDDGSYALLDRDQASNLLSLPFTSADSHEARERVQFTLSAIREDRRALRVPLGALLSLYDTWLLPEVSYLPSVLERLEIFARSMPVSMIGYDALPMTDPANYRFVPGYAANVSEYFRRLSTVDTVVCISYNSRMVILDRLRRDRALRTSVAHPGGDHIPVSARLSPQAVGGAPRFIRLGTMEARKKPVQILRGFQQACRSGLSAELVFVGNPSASDQRINDEVLAAIADGYPVTWIQGAADAEVYDLVREADAFLSIGVEGYGIPVLEAIRLGTPVLYDGVQPAADLMAGMGARRINADSEETLATMFIEFASTGVGKAIRDELNPDAVPTWTEFAGSVALAAARV